MGAEFNLGAKFPQSEVTVNSIVQYQTLMEEMRGEFEISHYTIAKARHLWSLSTLLVLYLHSLI